MTKTEMLTNTPDKAIESLKSMSGQVSEMCINLNNVLYHLYNDIEAPKNDN